MAKEQGRAAALEVRADSPSPGDLRYATQVGTDRGYCVKNAFLATLSVAVSTVDWRRAVPIIVCSELLKPATT